MNARIPLLMSLCAALLACAASADVVISHSVVGAGGGESGGASHTIVATLGQPIIGVVSGPSNINEIGFWYQPGWILTGVQEDHVPTRYSLGQNCPNPFNPVTTFSFALPERSRVTVKLYDVAGREVRTLVDEVVEPGCHSVLLDAHDLSSGVYFCRMTAGVFVETRKLVLMK